MKLKMHAVTEYIVEPFFLFVTIEAAVSVFGLGLAAAQEDTKSSRVLYTRAFESQILK